MTPRFLIQIPKPKTDMGVFGNHNGINPFFLTSDEDYKLHTLQSIYKNFDLFLKSMNLVISPKFMSEISTLNVLSVGLATNSPENVSDCEDEFKYTESINLNIERMKASSCHIKESQPLSNKGEVLSPLDKNKAKIEKLHTYKNLIFNPSCQKDVLEQHLKKVRSSLTYVSHLKKPNDLDLHLKYVFLGEQKSKN